MGEAAAETSAPKKGAKRWVIVGLGLAVVGAALGFGVFEVHTAFYDVEVNEALSIPPGASAVHSGEFHDVFHAGKGKARVVRKADGSHELQLEALKVDNGPTLRLVLLAAADATDNETVESSGYLDLGDLKGNVGSQAYALPASYDPEKHRAVTVWCDRFSVNFATAPLTPASVTPTAQ